MNKNCSCCKETKELDLFVKDKYSRDGRKSLCLKCSRIKDAEYNKKNKEARAAKVRKWYSENREYAIAMNVLQNKKRHLKKRGIDFEIDFVKKSDLIVSEPPEIAQARARLRKKEHNSKLETKRKNCERIKNKYKNDPGYKIQKLCRTRIVQELKDVNLKKTNRTVDLLGCSLEEAKRHIESQWKEGMNWDNHGLWKIGEPMTWHIDHIIPCDFFDLTDNKQLFICFNWKNLRPEWADKNISKSNKITELAWGIDFSI